MNIAEVNVRLKVVRKKLPLSFKIILAYWVSGLIAMITFICGEKYFDHTIAGWILVIMFLSSNLIMFVGGSVIKKYKETGNFELTNDELIIFQNDNSEVFKLSEIEIIRFTLTREQGEPVGRMAVSEGVNNYFVIKKDGKVIKYNFLVENLSQVNFLRRKIAFLKEKEYKITISP
jgi:hypothetical protein